MNIHLINAEQTLKANADGEPKSVTLNVAESLAVFQEFKSLRTKLAVAREQEEKLSDRVERLKHELASKSKNRGGEI